MFLNNIIKITIINHSQSMKRNNFNSIIPNKHESILLQRGWAPEFIDLTLNESDNDTDSLNPIDINLNPNISNLIFQNQNELSLQKQSTPSTAQTSPHSQNEFKDDNQKPFSSFANPEMSTYKTIYNQDKIINLSDSDNESDDMYNESEYDCFYNYNNYHQSEDGVSYQDRNQLYLMSYKHPIMYYNLKKALNKPLSKDNIGYILLKKKGYVDGNGLGKNSTGIIEPLSFLDIKHSFTVNVKENEECFSYQVIDSIKRGLITLIRRFFKKDNAETISIGEENEDKNLSLGSEEILQEIRFQTIEEYFYLFEYISIKMNNILQNIDCFKAESFKNDLKKLYRILNNNEIISFFLTDLFLFKNKLLLMSNLLHKILLEK